MRDTRDADMTAPADSLSSTLAILRVGERVRVTKRTLAHLQTTMKDIAPGCAVTVAAAAAASFVSVTCGGPVILVAFLLGIL